MFLMRVVVVIWRLQKLLYTFSKLLYEDGTRCSYFEWETHYCMVQNIGEDN